MNTYNYIRVSTEAQNTERQLQEITCDVEFLEKVEFEKIKRIYKERFVDANNFTFVFVGNIEVETFKPLVETYLASLPNVKNDETFKDNGVRAPKKTVERVITKKLEVPKSTVSINYSGEFDYDDYFKRINAKVISHVLELRFTEVIREKEGGTYGVRVRLSTIKYPWENYKLKIQFDCDNEKAKKLKKLVSELGYNSDIIFTGWRNDIPEIISALDLIVLPSEYEGCPGVLLEALGCETPCIGSDIRGIAEVLDYDDLLFKPLNVEELTKKLDKIVKDKEYYKKVKDLCLKRREKFVFDWHEKVINILKTS